MKKSTTALLSLLLSVSAATAQITNPTPYCAAGYDDGFAPVPHYIKNVSLGTLNNSTGTTVFAAPHYAYYNAVAAPNLAKGGHYNLSVSHDGGQTIHWVVVFIDYNHNNNFNDAGERVLQQKLGAISNPSVASITIPATAAAGTTRMRVMIFEDDMFTLGSNPDNAVPCTADATGSFDWGETEDYNVNITGSATAINDVQTHTTQSIIYPNPAKDKVYITDLRQDAIITISDLQGRLLLTQKANRSNGADVSSLKAGLYLIKISDPAAIRTSTLVIGK